MIYQELNEWDFVRAFDEADRSENFSRPARVALYNWLDELSEDTGENIKLDVIALCCEFTEYSEAELVTEYQDHSGEEPGDDEDETLENALEFFNDQTTVITVEHYGELDSYILGEF